MGVSRLHKEKYVPWMLWLHTHWATPNQGFPDRGALKPCFSPSGYNTPNTERVVGSPVLPTKECFVPCINCSNKNSQDSSLDS